MTDVLLSLGFCLWRILFQVVEYLQLSEKLTAKGYDSADVDYVLLTLNYSSQAKAAKHLDMQKIFREFGFAEERIREALLKNDLDEEKTLDWLTGRWRHLL